VKGTKSSWKRNASNKIKEQRLVKEREPRGSEEIKEKE
jgi:hypothetical protein